HCSGMSDIPSCWATRGFLSGYLSATHGEEIFVQELRCLAHGDSECHFLVHPVGDTNDDFPTDTVYFSNEQLVASLAAALEGARTSPPPPSRSCKTISNSKSDLPHNPPRRRSPVRASASPAMQEALDLAERVAQTD